MNSQKMGKWQYFWGETMSHDSKCWTWVVESSWKQRWGMDVGFKSEVHSSRQGEAEAGPSLSQDPTMEVVKNTTVVTLT